MKNLMLVLIFAFIANSGFPQDVQTYNSFASATKMNVVYVGVDNPIDIVVPGVPYEKMKVSITNGTITPNGPYRYIVKTNNPGMLTINVTADIDGKNVSVGQHDFRVKRIMDPVPMIAGMTGGTITKSLLLSQSDVMVVIQNFDFDVKFNVTGFTVSATIGGFEESKTSSSNKITPEMKGLIEKLKAGDKIYFSDIKVKGPDGVERNVGVMVFYVE